MGEKLPQQSGQSTNIQFTESTKIGQIRVDREGQGAVLGFDEESTSKMEQKKNLFCHERALALAKQSKFYEATSCLEAIISGDGYADQIGLTLLKAECYIHLGRESKAMTAISNLKDTLLTDPKVDKELLFTLGEALDRECSFLRSIIIFQIASKIFKNSRASPNEIVEGISRCIQASKDVLAKMSKGLSLGDTDFESSRTRVIIMDFGIEYMKEMLTDLRDIQGADVEKKTLKEAWGATHIGFVLGNLQECDKSFKIRKQGVQAMDRTFGDRAGHFHIYGVLLHNMGIMLSNRKKYAEAKEMYEKALTAKEMAIDYSGEQKQNDIDETRKALDRARSRMLL